MGTAYLLAACSNEFEANMSGDTPVKVDTVRGIIIYQPKFEKIEYYTGRTPSENDTSIIFCCTASFTRRRLFWYEKDNVSGPYVSTDRGYCEGYSAIDNPIAFVYEENRWRFQRDSIEPKMESCAKRCGIAFSQINILPADSSVSKKSVKGFSFRMKRHRYRALCEKNDTLLIAESIEPVDYDDFVRSLVGVGITKAIYLDCGLGWSYGWYRTDSASIKLLHFFKPPYISNWLVFKKH